MTRSRDLGGVPARLTLEPGIDLLVKNLGK